MATRTGLAVACVALCVLLGCAKREPIRTYVIEKQTPHRLLGAILLRGEVGWFFKLTGPKDELDAKAENFRAFVKSIRFEDRRPMPKWTLPDGWELLPSAPTGMRLATIKVPLKSKDAELTVTVLERQAGNDTEYLLQNINRWREQMSQGAIGDPDLERLEKIDANGSAAYIISVAGKQKAGGMAGPMMGGRG